MTISAHLTPDPERRLWIIFESMRHSVEWADRRIGALTAFAAAELAVIRVLAPAGPLGLLVLASLSVALPLGVLAFSQLTGTPKRLPFLDPPSDKPSASDNMISADDIAKYTHQELIGRLDRYLGGGITSTQYYEDLVGQIVILARIASRKQRLFRAACVLVGVAQLGLLGHLIRR